MGVWLRSCRGRSFGGLLHLSFPHDAPDYAAHAGERQQETVNK